MKRLLFIAHRLPYPPDKGERLRAFHEIKALAGEFHVTVASLTFGPHDRAAAQALGQWCHEVVTAPATACLGLAKGAASLLRGRAITQGYFESHRLLKRMNDIAECEPFDLVLGYSSGVLPMVCRVPAPVHVMDLVDIDSAKWAAYASRAAWGLGWLYALEARRVRQLEHDALRRCDAVLVVSRAEAQALGPAGQSLIPIGNGVDGQFFWPRRAKSKTPSLVFTGSMDYRPNIEGVCWFVDKVWPSLRSSIPDITFTIVGRNPAKAVRALAGRDGVIVTGAVRDVRPFLAQADVAVAPLQIARGIQNKILEAMAMACPVVASPQALEGLDATAGRDILLADTPEQWVETLTRLLLDAEIRERLGWAGRSLVEDAYTWERRLEPLVALCRRLTDSPAQPVWSLAAASAASPPGAGFAPVIVAGPEHIKCQSP